jgi:hypothetical protein
MHESFEKKYLLYGDKIFQLHLEYVYVVDLYNVYYEIRIKYKIIIYNTNYSSFPVSYVCDDNFGIVEGISTYVESSVIN